MKIKEVCKLTNLTERTIRYYVERQLIAPEIEIINGREYRNYSEKDVEQLLLIAELRKLFFSIDTITEMFEDPQKIGSILKHHEVDLSEETDKKQEVIEALKRIDTERINSAGELVESLKHISVHYELPECDTAANFGRFDSETKEEKAILSEQAWKNIMNTESKRRKSLKNVAFLIIILSICALIGYKIYSYKNRYVYSNTFIPSIKFTEVKVDENRELIARFQVFEKGFGYDEHVNNTITSKFEKSDAGNNLYSSILTNTEYAAVMIGIKIKIKTANELGVLQGDNISTLNINKILSDEELSKKYTTILFLQGDLK